MRNQQLTDPRYSLLVTKAFLCLALLILIFGLCGTIEHTDNIYYSIPAPALEEISMKLGKQIGKDMIISEYLSDQDYYDNL